MSINIYKKKRLKFISLSMVVISLLLISLGVIFFLHRNGTIVLPHAVSGAISSILLIIATLFVTTLTLRLTISRVYNLFDEPEERIFYSKIYSWSLYTVAVFILLHHFGVSLGNITLFIGLLATGLAFAIRDVLLSFFGWIILLRKKPFRIGDYIRIGDDHGKVLHIGTFYVLLESVSELPDDYTRIPNRLFLEKSICKIGHTRFREQLRFQLANIPVNKGELYEKLRSRIIGILKRDDRISIYTDMANEKLYLLVEYTVDFNIRRSIKSEVIDETIGIFKDSITL